mgnify:CR=1 FL=1
MFQEYVHVVLLVAVKLALFTVEPMVNFGAVSTGSLKVAVMVILSPGFIKLSASFVEMLNVGEAVSTVNEIFCEPAT